MKTSLLVFVGGTRGGRRGWSDGRARRPSWLSAQKLASNSEGPAAAAAAAEPERRPSLCAWPAQRGSHGSRFSGSTARLPGRCLAAA